MEAQLLKGDPTAYVDYTPSGADVAAGEVIASGSALLIPHRPIADGATGSMAVGGGVYTVSKGTADAGLTLGVTARFVAASGIVTSATATANLPFGVVTKAAASSDATVEVLHVPNTANLA